MRSESLSIVVVAYNMARELPRTILSLSRRMQRGGKDLDYEIIVVDNGSESAVDPGPLRQLHPDLRVERLQSPGPSPVPAINRGIALARHPLIGVWIDGARLASPGLLQGAINAQRIHPKPVIGTLSFHLGPAIQRESIKAGYCQAEEDRLLASVDWTTDGYQLFLISTPGGSAKNGWFLPIPETGSVFLTHSHWIDLGGYDEAFVERGGGLANLDLWRRAVLSDGALPIMLLGEATFHQLHGGAATNALQPMFHRFQEEYVRLHGVPFRQPHYRPLLLGDIPLQGMGVLDWSAKCARLLT